MGVPVDAQISESFPFIFGDLLAFRRHNRSRSRTARRLLPSAAFSGSVSDSSGARVPNAKVTLNNPEKGITRAFKTDAEGNFSFALLPAGTYTLTVEAAGFKTSKQTGITLEVGQSASQSITLTIGSAEQIEVTCGSPSSAGG